MGDYRSVIHPPGENSTVYSMGYEDVPERAHWGTGRRNYCILHYVTKGRGCFCGHEVHSGQGFYIHAGQMHEYHADEQDGWNYFWMIFSEELAKKYVLPYIASDEHGIFEAAYEQELLVRRRRIFAQKRPMQYMQALETFFSILSLHEQRHAAPSSLPLAHVSSAKLLIENSFGRRLTVREVARELYIDDRYLYNLFKKYEGVSVKEYIDRRRTERACALLDESRMSISQIARALEFEDAGTFCKFFRTRTGMPPTAYRERKN